MTISLLRLTNDFIGVYVISHVFVVAFLLIDGLHHLLAHEQADGGVGVTIVLSGENVREMFKQASFNIK